MDCGTGVIISNWRRTTVTSTAFAPSWSPLCDGDDTEDDDHHHHHHHDDGDVDDEGDVDDDDDEEEDEHRHCTFLATFAIPIIQAWILNINFAWKTSLFCNFVQERGLAAQR